MFSGLISAVGRIADTRAIADEPGHGRRLGVDTPAGWLDDVQLGDSIAIDGACMTVTGLDAAAHRFAFDVSAESLDKTVGFTAEAAGRAVNLEKALRAHDRLGGHLVAGHVDGVGRVSYFEPVGESWELRVEAPRELAKFLAGKGSITVNGVSLTVNRVVDRADACEFSVNLIPHTVAHTALGELAAGAAVNLEVDLIARYVERMLDQASNPPN